MDKYAQQRQDKIRQLLDSDSLTLATTKAVLLSLLDVTASARTGPDVTSYGIDGSIPTEVVDARHAGREEIGDELDAAILHALQDAPDQLPQK